MKLVSIKRKISPWIKNFPGWRTDRKIVVIESDDWGSIRMPSREVYEKCEGYWDRNLNWHPGPFDPQGWMVESVVQLIRNMSRNVPITLK